MKRVLGFGLLMTALAAGSSARAACEKDTDCKGDRICVDGACTNAGATAPPLEAPQSAPQTPPQTPPQAATTPENTAAACQGGLDEDGDGLVDCADPECSAFIGCASVVARAAPVAPSGTLVDPGWSRGAAITGLVLGPLALGLFVGSAVTVPEKGGSPLPSAPLGGSALLFHVVGGGIAGGGALSSRGVEHNLGCLVSGWTFYGATIVYTALAFGIGFGLEAGPPHPAVIGVGGLLSLVASVTLASDGLIVSKRARLANGGPPTAERSRRVAVYPLLAPVVSQSRTVGVTGGVGMVF